jgi:hypothetical protein
METMVSGLYYDKSWRAKNFALYGKNQKNAREVEETACLVKIDNQSYRKYAFLTIKLSEI